jgi:hypothetical protein
MEARYQLRQCPEGTRTLQQPSSESLNVDSIASTSVELQLVRASV